MPGNADASEGGHQKRGTPGKRPAKEGGLQGKRASEKGGCQGRGALEKEGAREEGRQGRRESWKGVCARVAGCQGGEHQGRKVQGKAVPGKLAPGKGLPGGKGTREGECLSWQPNKLCPAGPLQTESGGAGP